MVAVPYAHCEGDEERAKGDDELANDWMVRGECQRRRTKTNLELGIYDTRSEEGREEEGDATRSERAWQSGRRATTAKAEGRETGGK